MKYHIEIYHLFCQAVEASRCYFFENWWMILKCPLLQKPLATIVHENSQYFYPSEPFRIIHFTMRHPVDQLKFHPYSILTGDTRVEFVIYRVLMDPLTNNQRPTSLPPNSF